MKKLVAYVLGLLLLAAPLLGALAQEASAASSRVAVIKELKGTVKVKKSGGSKEFTAFAKMSLNEGDIVTVGSDGSAVLQFANGSSEDDRMTVSANTTLTFFKLKEGKNTVTKVSVQSGSVWSTVKSIKSASDEYTLETPTAIMGVRGTNLLVYVDPVTGDSKFVIFSGVGQIAPTNTRTISQPPDVVVLPNHQVTIDDRNQTNQFPGEVIPIDLSSFLNGVSPQVIESIIGAKNAIDQENQQFIEKKKQELEAGQPGTPTGSSADLDRIIQNLNNLITNMLQEALKGNKITPSELQKLVDEANPTLNKKIDLANTPPQVVTDAEKLKMEKLKKQQEARQEAAKKQKEEELKSQRESLIKKIEEERAKQEEANKKALEDAKKKAKEEYEKKLSEAEKKRFEEESKKREEELKKQTAPRVTPTPTTGGGGGGTNPGSSPSSSPSQSPSPSPSESPSPASEPFQLYFSSNGTSTPVKHPVEFDPEITEYTIHADELTNRAIVKRSPDENFDIGSVSYYDSQSGQFTSVYFDENEEGYSIPLVLGTNEIKIMVQQFPSPPGESSSSNMSEFTLNIVRASQPQGLTGWEVTVPGDPDAEPLVWEPTGADKYALDLGENYDSQLIPELEMRLDFGEGITRAELEYKDRTNEQYPLITLEWTESGQIKMINHLAEGYTLLTLRLYQGQTLYSTKSLWLINGFTDLNDNHPVDVSDNFGSSVFYETDYEGYHYQNIYVREDADSISLIPSPNMLVESATFAGQSATITYGSALLPLAELNGTIELKMRDSSGLREFDYEFEVYRVPTGISKWQLKNYEDSIQILNAAGNHKYYAEVFGQSEAVELQIQGAGSTLKRNGETINSSQGVLNLSPHLNDELNLFELEVVVGGETLTYELGIWKGQPQSFNLLSLDPQIQLSPVNNNDLAGTTIAHEVYLTVWADRRYVTVTRSNGETIALGEDGFPLMLEYGENVFVVSISVPYMQHQQYNLTINRDNGQV